MRGRNGESAIDPVDARAPKQEQVSLHSQALSGQAGKGLELQENAEGVTRQPIWPASCYSSPR
jgi:hypothetical protein